MDINIPADYKPSDADRVHAEDRQELARLLAKTHLPDLVTRLVENSIDPSASHKQIMDTADYLYRVSGLSAKQEKKEGPTGFSIQIILPGQNREITIGGGAAVIDKTEEEQLLDAVPEYIATLPLSDTLSEDLNLGEL